MNSTVAPTFWTRRRTVFACGAVLALHYGLAASSLLRENPTVDEVAHLPAGVTYWQKGTFRLYRHNPPLVKLVAALPVVLAGAHTEQAYQSRFGWQHEYPSQAVFAQEFLLANVDRYFELFALARLTMPLWSILGGLAVFFWARSLYGNGGALVSVALWCLCPNILAHGRLVTSDVASAAVGCLATFLFWRYLQSSTWRRALVAGAVLGLAQLVKFSGLLLYLLWPMVWLIYELARPDRFRNRKRLGHAVLQGGAMVALSVFVIDVGYGFEGVGTPIGRLPFASRSPLTREGVEPRAQLRPSQNALIDLSWKHRVNRFRGTWLEGFPSPLPREYLMGFDEQKIETDGLPLRWIAQEKRERGQPLSRAEANAGPNDVTTYPVYLDGDLRRRGWRDYYVRTLLYKIPEGTWVLFGVALVVMCRGCRARWADEATLLFMSAAILGAMSFLTDINIGIRYVLGMLPYMFIFCGKVVRWGWELREGVGRGADRLSKPRVNLKRLVVGSCLLATAVATFSIQPHFLAYFNWLSGGPARGSEHLIDSNIDWGQDLVGLEDWVRRHRIERPIGLVYFGQIPPRLLQERGGGFSWFVPPAIDGRMTLLPGGDPHLSSRTLVPGIYAVSASMLRGLPWRLYTETSAGGGEARWVRPTWNAGEDAFAYFRELAPMTESIGHSIVLFNVKEEDARRINQKYGFGDAAPRRE